MEPQDGREDRVWDLARLTSPGTATSARADGVARLLRAVEEPGNAGTVRLLVGDTGMGRTTLLDALARHASSRGCVVLRAQGSESERDLPFATLHQLLRPVPDRIDLLPGPQGSALRSATSTGTGDVLVTGNALLDLLSGLAAERPVLLLVDDAHRCDQDSLDTLAFAARRLGGEAVTLLLATETGHAVRGAGRDVPVTVLQPLDDAEASRLLEGLPARPTARLGADILEQAAGNPLALTELSRAAALDPGGSQTSAGPLPLTDDLAQAFGTGAAGLPHATRQALLCLAAMDPADAAVLPAPTPAADGDGVWEPAEGAGLVRRTGRRVRFRHPLVRSAVYQTAAPEDRSAAHRALAELLHGAPDRHAWHLAASRTGPDAAVSVLLERTVEQARRRGGPAAAGKALHRAAELTPDAGHGARLLAEGARHAVLTGDLAWVEHLAQAVRTRTDDAALVAAAAVQVSRLTVLTARHTTAFARLMRSAAELATTQPGSALDVLADAAVARFYSGREAERHAIHALLRSVPEDAGQAWLRAWVRIVCDPLHGGRADLRTLGARLAAERSPEQLTYLGIAAWLLDRTSEAVDTFDVALDAVHDRTALPNGLGGAAGWAYLERGRWDRAREVSARLIATGTAAGLDHAVACATAVDATVLALRGDVHAARDRAERALALVDPVESRSVLVYVRRALAAAAAAEGDHGAVYQQLRAAFDADGRPVHYHASYAVLADLAAAAGRTGHRREASGIVELAARDLGEDASPRLRALLHRARGLLADPGSAEPHLRAALDDPSTEHWPFERAQASLDLAEWLRRRRRVAEARAPLAEALETFRRLGAEPWAERARAESRAAGVDLGAATSEGLADLSPQQQQIIRLAARGLTNREIGERLFLSPRTVGSHLYRSFPRLGVTARSQLRDVVEDT